MSQYQLKKKVLLVMECWGEGGTETYVNGLLNSLSSDDKINISVLFLRQYINVDEHLPGAKRIYYSSHSNFLISILKARPDVINLHLYSSLLYAVFMAKISGVKCVTTLHMPPCAWGLRHRGYWRLACLMSNCIVGVSGAVIDNLSSNRKRAIIIPGGVESEFFRVVRNNTKYGDFKIAAVGRLAPEKNWLILIRGISLLSKEVRSRVVINFYGDGPLQDVINEYALKREVNVRFHGYVSKKTLRYELSYTHLSILPSKFEGLGLSALECMAVGVPTITSDFVASREYILPGVTGHTFPAEDVESLKVLINWHIMNPELSEIIGREGKKFVRERYYENFVYRKYIDVFKEFYN
ncbi:Glycosyltransferase involved in cell wall bisynthesis [Franzmannia pantelleriensis]|uniref:Glycosyltransferase involved in cell wall bisynthesis n=1 Tax=Franzmannia pantelleriensis TaxID=48727 RepID=A0A1G9ES83_9GAMM|nr:glycosyltransferase family 4 protein [Halomonas pantelleriensis]SDK79006.1 Glycosyltransferase involved in cell wall bisynthesis [Halomonas pantelleriensis]